MAQHGVSLQYCAGSMIEHHHKHLKILITLPPFLLILL